MGFCPSGLLSQWAFVPVGFCPSRLLSQWAFVPVGFCPVGYCPVGFCPSRLLSQWAFVPVGFCPFPLYVYALVCVLCVQSEIHCKDSVMTMHYQTRQIHRFIHPLLSGLHILNTTQVMKKDLACKEL